MHLQQARFVMALRVAYPGFFLGKSVLEIGSYNVNGSIRDYFVNPSRYVGVDLIEGPCVDVIGDASALEFPDRFDFVLSTECFEHAPHFLGIFRNMIRHAKIPGLVAFTCATTGRPEHGTRRTTPEDSPGTIGVGQDHYRNVGKEDFPTAILRESFLSHQFFVNDETHDLYFVGLRFSDPLSDSIFSTIAENSGAVRI